MMRYSLIGRLCGYICPECPEPLSGVTVRLYQPREAQEVTALAVARPSDTLSILDKEGVEAKSASLLAEVQADEEGHFVFELDDKRYQGGPLELDVRCESVPGRKSGAPEVEPLQLSITTLQPQWRGSPKDKDAARWSWDYCVPSRVWCAVRGRLGAWTICGRVTDCESGAPVSEVTVHAFDADWIQPDALGSAVTDASGKFRIDYLRSDFEKTPFSPLIDVELVGGPDLYFKADFDETEVLSEQPSRGRRPDRENAGPCICVELCVEGVPPVDQPWFTHIGDFQIYDDIDAATGKLNTDFNGHAGPGWGFFDSMKLKGYCPAKSQLGEPMRYRFLYEHPDNPGVQVPITGEGLVDRVVVGVKLVSPFPLDFQTIEVRGASSASSSALILVPDSEGWIEVPEGAVGDALSGPLIRFKSAGVVGGGRPPDGVAGSPAADPKNGVALKLIFEAGPVDGATSGNEVEKVLINNWHEALELSVAQLGGPGGSPCSPLSKELEVEYTVDHELLAEWELAVHSDSGDAPGTVHPPYPPGTTARGHAGSYVADISHWGACSYVVSLAARRMLTDGEVDAQRHGPTDTFCISRGEGGHTPGGE